MPGANDNTGDVAPNRRLTVRLTKLGERERVLEFHAGNDGARVIGCAPSSDVVLRDAGVLPVHCYFEREAGNIWLAAAQDTAAIRVNYQPVVGRVKLPARSILEVGQARVQVLVFDADENAPRHGPFGTEVVERAELGAVADLFATKPVDVSLALGALATSAWSKMDVTPNTVDGLAPSAEASTATLEYNLRPEQPSPENSSADRPPMAGGKRAAFEALTTTARIPRPNLIVASGIEPIQPAVPSPCILVQSPRGLLPAVPQVLPSDSRQEQSSNDATLVSRAPHVLPESSALPQGQPSSVTAATTAATLASAAPMPAAFVIDPASFTTIGHPIADLPGPVEPAVPTKPRGPAKSAGTSVALLRQRFAAGLGREPRVVAVIAFCAALALSALILQSVRAWRQIAVPVVSGSSNRARVQGARTTAPRSNAPTANDRPSAGSSALNAPSEDVAQPSGGDALVAQAVSHLLLGQQVEAAEAYGVLAARYPGEPVYTTIAKVLRRRLNPACREGGKGECEKVVP